MSEINTNIWGTSENWKDAVNYANDVPDKEKIQYASVDGTTWTMYNYVAGGRVNARQALDQSLCYGALGKDMPLSNIVNTAGAVGWREQEDGETPWRSYIANLQAESNQDKRTITNYAFAAWTTNSGINKEHGETLYMRSAQRNDRFHQFWYPDSKYYDLINWTNSEKEANPFIKSMPIARIPVKNMIAYPVVRCINDVEILNPTEKYIDLLNYIDTTTQYNYTNYPYVISVGLVFLTAQNGVQETINRNLTLRLNSCMILSPSNMLQNMPYYVYDGYDKNARYDGEAYNYASCIGKHYRNQVSCIMPIMGLINSPERNAPKFSSVNIKTGQSGEWTLFDVRFDLGTSQVATMGGGYELLMYSWAGKQPEIYTIQDSDPNHTDSQQYTNSTQYWAWHITASNVDTFREEVRQATAGFGLFFVEGAANGNLALDDPDMFLGILEDGVGNGKYSHGEDNRNQPQWNWDDMHENDYDPSNPPIIDPNTYNGSMSTGTLEWFQTATPKYNISFINYPKIIKKLWDCLALLPAGDPLADYCLDTFLTQNPIDTIVSLKYFPISEALGWGEAVTVRLGKFDTQVSALKAKNQILYDCGTILIYPRYGKGIATWLDKLTTITLYLPFCGTVSLEADKYMGRYVGVEYAIDLNTGNCSAYVYTYADTLGTEKLYTEVANGTCGIDLPVTGIQHITLDGQLYNATEQLKGMRVNAATQGISQLLALTSAPSQGLAGGLSQLAQTGGSLYNMLHNQDIAQYNLEHTQLPVKMIGTTGAATSAMLELYPTILIERPYTDGINENYFAHTNGYACCISDQVSAFAGYTEFANIDLSGFNATAAEKDMIRSLCSGGIYI